MLGFDAGRSDSEIVLSSVLIPLLGRYMRLVYLKVFPRGRVWWCLLLIPVLGAEEMAQWLRALLAALPEDLGSIPSTYTMAHTCLLLQFQGFWHPNRHTWRQNTSEHKIKINYIFKKVYPTKKTQTSGITFKTNSARDWGVSHRDRGQLTPGPELNSYHKRVKERKLN